MAANNATADSAQLLDSRQSLDARSQTRARSPVTTERELDDKMPASVKAFGDALTAGAGRTFACPECGDASAGKCPTCGYTHKAYRTSNDGGRE